MTGDSSGTPWTGRDLPVPLYAGDTGMADDNLTEALAQLAPDRDGEAGVVSAVARARLFVAVVAMADVDDGEGEGEGAQMALITLTGADGRRALPVFSSTEALASWRPEARPVPVPGQCAALSAVAEGCELLDLDPAGPTRYVLGRPAVWAVGRGLTWIPSYANPLVAQEVSALCAAEGLRVRCGPGTDAELRLTIGVPAGLSEDALQEVLARLNERLGRSALVAECVDSVEVTVLAVEQPGPHRRDRA